MNKLYNFTMIFHGNFPVIFEFPELKSSIVFFSWVLISCVNVTITTLMTLTLKSWSESLYFFCFWFFSLLLPIYVGHLSSKIFSDANYFIAFWLSGSRPKINKFLNTLLDTIIPPLDTTTICDPMSLYFRTCLAVFFFSSRFSLQPYELTIRSILLFCSSVHEILTVLRDVIFLHLERVFFCLFAGLSFWSHVTYPIQYWLSSCLDWTFKLQLREIRSIEYFSLSN